jgi:Flp pilus assembly protein TadG
MAPAPGLRDMAAGAARRRPHHWRGRARVLLIADRGSFTLLAAIAALGFYVIAGFAVDAGVKMQAAVTARSTAEEAARAGVMAINKSAAYAHGGQFVTDPTAAVTAAEAYLSQSGHTGSVTVTGNRTVQVTVTVTNPAVFTRPIGFAQLSATETATATLVQGITGPQP